MSKFEDLTGQKFNRWAVLEYRFNGRSAWLCRCECGTERVVTSKLLKNGESTSCGCRKREVTTVRNTTHGRCGTRVYKSWAKMLDRCRNPNNKDYAHYGGRGITVCERWHSFENFFADMGHPPFKHEIDRENNDLGYCKENCRWVTHLINMSNTRRTRLFTHQGETLTLREWAEKAGVPYSRMQERINNGETFEQAYLDTRNRNFKREGITIKKPRKGVPK